MLSIISSGNRGCCSSTVIIREPPLILSVNDSFPELLTAACVAWFTPDLYYIENVKQWKVKMWESRGSHGAKHACFSPQNISSCLSSPTFTSILSRGRRLPLARSQPRFLFLLPHAYIFFTARRILHKVPPKRPCSLPDYTTSQYYSYQRVARRNQVTLGSLQTCILHHALHTIKQNWKNVNKLWTWT
jgi:hypothetical protein